MNSAWDAITSEREGGLVYLAKASNFRADLFLRSSEYLQLLSFASFVTAASDAPAALRCACVTAPTCHTRKVAWEWSGVELSRSVSGIGF